VTDLTLVEQPDGVVTLHLADCPDVEVARKAGWPLATMMDLQRDPTPRMFPELATHECAHDALREFGTFRSNLTRRLSRQREKP
jgi:hypothetical protein